jgi:hypothetical protein
MMENKQFGRVGSECRNKQFGRVGSECRNKLFGRVGSECRNKHALNVQCAGFELKNTQNTATEETK